jgi:hypothetical protein
MAYEYSYCPVVIISIVTVVTTETDAKLIISVVVVTVNYLLIYGIFKGAPTTSVYTTWDVRKIIQK